MVTKLDVLAELSLLWPKYATVSTITRRLGPVVDGREVRQALDAVVASGEAEYLNGQGNNRRYRLADRMAS